MLRERVCCSRLWREIHTATTLSNRLKVRTLSNCHGIMLSGAALSKAIESGDTSAPVKAFRDLSHADLERDFFEVQKMAKLRSGARGAEARKVLIEYERKMEASKANLEQLKEKIEDDVVEEETKKAVEMLEGLQTELSTMQTADVEAKGRQALVGLGFKETQLSKPFSSLSGGWKMRCLLAATLVQTSDVLILDEPTNYLDLLGILWLQNFLESLRDSSPDTIVVLVSHDRDFVNATTTETIILRDHNLKYFPGNVSSYDKSIRHEIIRMTRMKETQDKQAANLQKQITHGMQQGRKHGDDKAVKQAKSKQKKLDERVGLQVSAKGTRFKLNRDLPGYHNDGRRAAIEIPKLEREITLPFPEAPDLRFPGSLVSLEKVSLKYRANPKPTLEDVDLVIHRGDKIGILGLNGCGKSTVIRLLVEQIKPSKGTVTRHPRLRMGYYSQHAVDALKVLAAAEPHLTALSLILRHAADADEEKTTEQAGRALLSGLGLPSHVATEVPVARLSGGQLVRLELARVLQRRPHLLVLDEPTTHLDLPTVHALTESLAAWEGTVVLVSHDRFLIRCVVEGEPVEDWSESEGEDSDGAPHRAQAGEEAKKVGGGRRIVYELKGGRLVEKAGGVASWETGLEGRLRKLGL